MALPYIVTEAVWTAKALTETKELKSDFSKCITKVIEVITDGFSGTLDIQGKQSLGATYDNIPYQLMGQAAPQAASVAQISVALNSARYRYVVPEYWSFLRLVMTRTAGTITVTVLGVDTAFLKDLIVKLAANTGVDIGDVDVLSIAAGANIIGKVNIKRVPVITPTTGGATKATAIATLAPGAAFKLLGVRIHFNGVLDAAETLTITRNSATDAYDTPLFTLDIGTPDIVDVKIPFGGEDDFYSATDEIVIALSANEQSRVWGCDTIHELV